MRRVLALGVAVALAAGCTASPGAPPTPAPTPSVSTPGTPSASTPDTPSGPGTCHAGPTGRPDPGCTPGALNPAVTQATIRSTICVAGWTKTVRPPASYTDRLKVTQIRAYGYADTNVRDYEEDHLVPLELGGDPRDPRNLWPEPHTQSPAKDTAENALKADVCYGRRTLGQAQAKILADWGP